MVVELEMEFEAAEMVAVPWPEVVANPLLPAALLLPLLMMATLADDELQVTTVVRF
jgi:hypothetical protein